MHLLYKPIEEEIDINFSSLYLRFSKSENKTIKHTIAKCLHEAFKLIEEEDDTTDLRKVFITFLLDTNRDIILIINSNLGTLLSKYGNKNTISSFKGRTPYVIDSASDESYSPASKTSVNSITEVNFSSAILNSGNKKNYPYKKMNTYHEGKMRLGSCNQFPEEKKAPKLPPIFASEEY